MSQDLIFARDQLDPSLTELGLLTGVVTTTDQGDHYRVDPNWFNAPLNTNTDQRVPSLLELLDLLLGSVSESALGKAVNGTDRLWYPLRIPSDLGSSSAPTPPGNGSNPQGSGVNGAGTPGGPANQSRTNLSRI